MNPAHDSTPVPDALPCADPVPTATAAAAPKALRQPAVLTLPDWQGAPAHHWLTHWEQQHGLQRVKQHDWNHPLRGDWMMQLQETLMHHKQAHLLAHGLGAHLVDAWLQHTQQAGRVLSVLLIDPIDLNEPELRQSLHTWKSVPATAWPMPLAVLWKERHPTPGGPLAEMLRQWGASPLSATPVGAGALAGWGVVNEFWTQNDAAPNAGEGRHGH